METVHLGSTFRGRRNDGKRVARVDFLCLLVLLCRMVQPLENTSQIVTLTKGFAANQICAQNVEIYTTFSSLGLPGEGNPLFPLGCSQVACRLSFLAISELP